MVLHGVRLPGYLPLNHTARSNTKKIKTEVKKTMLEIKVTIGLEPNTAEMLGAFLAAMNSAKVVGVDLKSDPAGAPKPPKKAETVKTEETVDKTPKAEQKAAAPDIEDVRALLADAKHNYGLPKVKAILKKYGAGDLGSVPADKYDELIADIKTIGG